MAPVLVTNMAPVLVTAAIIAGCLLDLLFADPTCITHPVVLMGKFISLLENALTGNGRVRKGWKGLAKGAVLVVSLLSLTFLITWGLCRFAWTIHPALFFVIQAFWCYQALAAKGLSNEAMAVYRLLQDNEIPAARKQVARIVGRDTQALDKAGITKACVETVAENFSDGILAPLMYMLIGGAPLAMVYKAVNTMDSMVGYKNERYLYFGRAAARMDDLANYVPSRIAAFFWILASFLDKGADGKNAFLIWKRDRRKHASPNSAQTESACAGALHVQLAGPAFYFGKKVDKPVIGDDERPVETDDIPAAVRLMWISYALAAVTGLLVRIILIYVL